MLNIEAFIVCVYRFYSTSAMAMLATLTLLVTLTLKSIGLPFFLTPGQMRCHFFSVRKRCGTSSFLCFFLPKAAEAACFQGIHPAAYPSFVPVLLSQQLEK